MQTALRMEVRTLVERATRWLINNRHHPIDIGAAVGSSLMECRRFSRHCPTS